MAGNEQIANIRPNGPHFLRGGVPLVRDHVDPALAAISIGGIVTNHGVWLFPPESSGFINRDFSA